MKTAGESNRFGVWLLGGVVVWDSASQIDVRIEWWFGLIVGSVVVCSQ